MQIYNTLSRSKQDFKTDNSVGMYTCGPTVYDYPHIGNYRAYIFADLLKRFLLFKGFKVNHIMNITDVDDKTIKGSRAKNISLKDFTQIYEKAFFEDLKALNIVPADKYPRATEHIDEMVSIIQSLLEKNIAYKGEDGSYYYDISKFTNYGKLANLRLEDLKENAQGRVKNDEYTKDSVQDFALWKSWDEEDGDVFWETAIGKGRPGWHIECSAMSTKYLGNSFTIHTGGIDLIFPHHQNEIAQSEGSSGEEFVKYWLHNEWLLVDGKKMSKSLGNFFTLRDILSKGFDARAIRYLLLSTHYRQQLNFTFEGLDASKSALARIDDFVSALRACDGNDNKEVQYLSESFIKTFEEKLDDDLNISEALASLFDLIKKINILIEQNSVSKKDSEIVLQVLEKANSVLGFIQTKQEQIPKEVQELAQKRENARIEKDFDESDRLRDEISKLGYLVEDSDKGPRLKKV